MLCTDGKERDTVSCAAMSGRNVTRARTELCPLPQQEKWAKGRKERERERRDLHTLQSTTNGT